MAEYCHFDWGVRFNTTFLPTVENTSKKDKNTSIENLRLLAQSKTDLVNPRVDNEFLERFLKARKQRNPEIFNRLNGQDVLVQQALRDGFPGVLEKRDSHIAYYTAYKRIFPDSQYQGLKDMRGRCVLVFIASRWNCTCYSLLTIFRSLLLSLEFLIEEDLNQHRGFVFVIDWTEFTYKQSSYLSPKVLKLMIDGLQDCFPAKFKGVHFIGQPWYVEVALTFIKPFLKEKSKERIHLHGNNLGTLHQFVAKDVLPSELGGEEPPFNPLPWAEKLMSQSLE